MGINSAKGHFESSVISIFWPRLFEACRYNSTYTRLWDSHNVLNR